MIHGGWSPWPWFPVLHRTTPTNNNNVSPVWNNPSTNHSQNPCWPQTQTQHRTLRFSEKNLWKIPYIQTPLRGFSFLSTQLKNTLGGDVICGAAHWEWNWEIGVWGDSISDCVIKSRSSCPSAKLGSFHMLSWTLTASVHVPLTVLLIRDCFFATPPFLPIRSSTSPWLWIHAVFIVQIQRTQTQNWEHQNKHTNPKSNLS